MHKDNAPAEVPRRITSRSEYRIFQELDLRAHNLKRWKLGDRFRHPELHYQRRLRAVEFFNSQTGAIWRFRGLIAKFLLLRSSLLTGISFPAGVAGPGLSIAHFGSIVVNSQTSIGHFCRIHSATNIGVSRGGVPRIGSYVYIGPGAIIYGDITIGDRAVIGANAVVNKDVPAGETVAGVPARVIAHRDSSDMVPTWFPNYGLARDAPDPLLAKNVPRDSDFAV